MHQIISPLNLILKSSILIAIVFCLTTQIVFSAEDAEFVWVKGMGGTSYDFGRSITLDSSGNIYTVGNFGGTSDLDPGAGTSNLVSAGSTDIFVSKLDSDGDLVWAKKMGGTGSDSGNSITVDSSGNVYTTGSFSGTVDFDPGAGTSNLVSAGSTDIFVSKLDSDGDLVWVKKIGGTGGDSGGSITVDSSGVVHIAGTFSGTVDFDPGAGTLDLVSAGSTDIFVSKLDSDGDLVWAKKVGGTNSDSLGSMTLDSSGNVYAIGSFSGTVDFDPGAGTTDLTSAGFNDIYIIKLDSAGDSVWAKKMGGTFYDSGSSIAVDSSGNVYTTGQFGGTADFDPGAGTSNLVSAGSYDVFVNKLDSDGDFVWVSKMGESGSEYVNSMDINSSGEVYITGYSIENSTFDPETGLGSGSSEDNNDLFVSKFDSVGESVWEKETGGIKNEFSLSIVIDSSENIYITGYFGNTAGCCDLYTSDFDPSEETANLTPVGSSDIFILKLQNVILDTTAPVISAIATSTTDTTATVTWTTDELASSQINFGLTSTYNASTTESDTSPRVTSHSVTISNLKSCTKYHYRVRGTDASSNVATSSDSILRTTGCTGSASMQNQNVTPITTASGGSASLTESGKIIEVAVPPSFASSDATFQIVRLDSSDFQNTSGKPLPSLNFVGDHTYNLKAFTTATTTTSSFLEPLTITITYLESDVDGYDESSLLIYRYDSGSWNSLSNCNVDADENTVICETSNFSDFALFGEDGSRRITSSGSSGSRRNSTAVVAQNTPTLLPTPSTPQTTNQTLTIRGLLSLLNITLTPEQEIAVSELEKKEKASSCLALNNRMQLGSNDTNTNGEVTLLQKFLINQGLLSPDIPFGYFGNLTTQAVQKFQIQNNIVTEGTPQTTGFGGVGPVTRAQIAGKCLN